MSERACGARATEKRDYSLSRELVSNSTRNTSSLATKTRICCSVAGN